MFKRINPVSVTNVILFLSLSKYLYTIIVVILIIVSRVFSRLAEREEKAWSVSLLSLSLVSVSCSVKIRPECSLYYI